MHLFQIGIETGGDISKFKTYARLIQQKIIERWEGKQKDLLQVLWGRGFININNLKAYSVDRKKIPLE